MEFHNKYLGKPMVPTWIYASADPSDKEFEETVQAVEQALGFDLFIWQKTFIKNGEFRQAGMTTAHILRDLLNVAGDPIDYSRAPTSHHEQFYRTELRHIKQKLDDAGIPTRTVWFSERDRRQWYIEKEKNYGSETIL